MKILDKSPCSDHLPIYAKLKLDIELSVIASSSVPASDVTFLTINYQWAKATDVDVENYRHGTQSRLSHITILNLYTVPMCVVMMSNIDIILICIIIVYVRY